MTTLFDLVIEVVAKTALWLAAVVAVSAAVAWAFHAAARAARGGGGEAPLTRVMLWATAGAIAGASLAHRFGWPEPFDLAVWGRPLHVVWLLAGAAIGASAVTARPGGALPTAGG